MATYSPNPMEDEEWDAFCEQEDSAWFWHTSKWRAYQRARGAEDFSYPIREHGRIWGIVVLFYDRASNSYLMEGHPCPHPIGKWPMVPAACTVAAFRSNPFYAGMLIPTDDSFTRYSWQTQIVDLTQPVETIHAGLRKSYTSLINHVNGSHEITVDWEGDLIEPFRQLHAADAGRETRPQATWEMQRQWCKDGHGLIVGASLGGVLVAATYFIKYKNAAYYASSASLHKNVTHALIWRAMLKLKKHGVEQLELGWTTYDKSEKGKGIAQFKRGFGGEARTIYAVERRW